MKKIISLLVVLAMLMSMAPMAFAAETTETTEYREVTIPEAIELAELNDGNKYLVRGTVTQVTNTMYGNMYIEDADGNSLLIYGTYSEDGTVRYDAMETKPQVGDEVLMLGILNTYNNAAQMKNGWVMELVVGEHEPEPEPEEITIAEALAIGAAQSHNTYTTEKYIVTGTITEIKNTTYGNMNIQDADGNQLYLYGVYSADGSTRFDAMDPQPQVGDTIKILGSLGQYYNTPQMKNGWVQEINPEVEEPVEPEDPTVEPNLFLGNNDLAAASYAVSEYTYIAEQTGTLYITVRSYACRGVEYGEAMLEYAWSTLLINDELVDSMQESLEVNAGDVITIKMTSDYDPYTAIVHLSYEGFYVEPVGSKFNPVQLTPEECPTTTVEIPAGGEAWYELDYAFSEHVLYVYGEDAYIAYEGWTEDGEWGEIYVYAVDGVVTYELWQYEIRIGNAGDTAATFDLDAVLPIGLESNPDQLVIGENIAEMTAGMWGYHYVWTAEEAGTLTITVSGGPYWAFRLQNLDTTEEYYYWEMENHPNTASVVVNAGDTVMLMLRLHEPVEWESIAGTLTVLAEFAPEGGEEGGEESGVSGWLHAYVKTESGYAWVKINAATGEFEALSDYSDVAYSGAGQGNDGMIYATVPGLNGQYIQIDPSNGYTATTGGDTAYGMPILDGTASAPTQTFTMVDNKGASVDVTVGGYMYYGASDAGTPYVVKLVDYQTMPTEIKYFGGFDEAVAEAIAYISSELAADGNTFYEYYLVVGSNGDLYKLTERTYAYGGGQTRRRAAELVADLNLDVVNGASMTMLNETTAVIAANNASGVTLYTYDLTAGALTELYTLAGVSDLVGLENYVVPAAELPLGNWLEIAAGTYAFTAEEDTLLAIAMTEAEWSYTINGVTRTHTDEVPVAATVLKVAAGETVTVVFDNVTYGNINVCAGTAEDPVYLPLVPNAANTAWALNADLPAGEYVYSMDITSSVFELTVNGEKTEYTVDFMGFEPATVVINNTAEANAVFEIELNYPTGTMYNPEELELGYIESEMLAFDSLSHWYVYTATEDTLLVVDLMGENWYYWGTYMNADGSYDFSRMTATYSADAETLVPVSVIKVAAGETFALCVGTIDGSETVAFTANTYAGTAENPVYLELRPNAANTAWALNADLPAGEYVYSMDISSTIYVLTVNGELTEYTVDFMGFEPATVVINNTEETNAVFEIELNYPAGTMYNPDELELGYQESQMIMFDSLSHWYSYTATEDTLLAIELMGENWYYWGVYMNADGSFDFSRMTTTYYADADTLVPMTVIKLAAGETFALCIGSIDGSEIVEFSAMTYAGTAEDPVLINFRWNDENTGASIMADLPAGEYVYGQYRISGMALTVNGEAVEYVDGGWFGPCTFTINNETGNNAVYTMELTYPEGHMMNPDMAELGDNVADVMANNYEGYFFNWIAPEDGTLTVTVTSDGGWFFTVQNETQGLYGEDHWCDDDPVVNTETIEVKAGDLIVIVVGTFDPVTFERPAGQVNVNLQFTPKPDVVMGDVNGDGSVDTTDAKLIMQYDLGLIDDTALTLEAADVNGDGSVDTTDAKLVMQLDLGLIEEF